ncbi:MAG: DUF4198 domain-containing protein [Celeribacter sp.]|jgi:uncharacterized GH25 family protein
MRQIIGAALICAISGPAWAHEFWISPEDYTVEPGGQIIAELRVGSEFSGAGYAYIPKRAARFETRQDGAVTLVEPRIGDRPALNVPAGDAGLVVVVHETADSTLTYDDWETFTNFFTHKDLPGFPQVHYDRGLPEDPVKEVYRRYAKSLIAVGNGAGQDEVTGLKIEIVARTNPYTDDLSDGMRVEVRLDGEPRVDTQVEVFERAADDTVNTSYYRTDAAGQTTFPVKPDHEYMVDSVAMSATDNDDPQAGPVWRSIWANLTFAVPE